MVARVSQEMSEYSFVYGSKQSLGGRFGYFYFFRLGEAEGGARGAGKGWGGVRFFIENPTGGGPPGWEGPRGWEGVSSEFGIWGGGLNIFFRGRNVHQESSSKGELLCLSTVRRGSEYG